MKKLILFLLCIATFLQVSNAATVYTPVKVSKSATNKIYVHLMPWFESKDYSGYWGIHWTMANQNPDIINGTRRQIASYYYPIIGPYASGDPDLVEYQLLMMKLSGVDGVLIDWPGTYNYADYVRNKQNAEAVINMMDKVGLQFAIVYEDHNIGLSGAADQIGTAKNDMIYARDNYFNKSSYIKVGSAPLLLDFGPQTIVGEANWTNVFSVFSTKPYFETLWYEHDDAGVNCKGEYAWIYSDYLTGLDNFYANRTNYGMKMGVAYPGFNAFYAAGGWGSNPFTIGVGTSTFQATLDKAFQYNTANIQLATWNDFGEGTMIEPTAELGYSCLTYLQQKVGVTYRQPELELVTRLYNYRKQYKGNATVQDQLLQVFYYLTSLQITAATNLLNTISGGGTVLVTGVTLSPTTATLAVNGTQQLTATVAPSNATNKAVTWTSSNTAIATVSTTGLVTAKAAGSATITVTTTDQAKTATCAVTVSSTNVPVTGVTMSPTSVSLAVNATQQLTATVAPSNATNKNLSWTSNNTTVATVSTSGLVTAKAAGTATITVTTADQSKTATCAVTVTSSSGVTYYKIKNRWQNTYLYDAGDRVRYATTAPDNSYQWTFEDIGSGQKEIKNRATGEYMHIENLLGYVQATARTSGWASSRWTQEDAGSGYIRLKNVWQSSYYIHVENLQNQAQYGTINTSWLSAQWLLEVVSSKALDVESSVNEVSIMPNPITDYMKVELNGNVFKNIMIYDITGRLQYSETINSGQSSLNIDFTDFKQGIYIIRLNNDVNSKVLKVVKR